MKCEVSDGFETVNPDWSYSIITPRQGVIRFECKAEDKQWLSTMGKNGPGLRLTKEATARILNQALDRGWQVQAEHTSSGHVLLLQRQSAAQTSATILPRVNANS